MFTLDSIIVGLIVLAALTCLGWRYYNKWKSPKSCGSKHCGCAPFRQSRK